MPPFDVQLQYVRAFCASSSTLKFGLQASHTNLRRNSPPTPKPTTIEQNTGSRIFRAFKEGLVLREFLFLSIQFCFSCFLATML